MCLLPAPLVLGPALSSHPLACLYPAKKVAVGSGHLSASLKQLQTDQCLLNFTPQLLGKTRMEGSTGKLWDIELH